MNVLRPGTLWIDQRCYRVLFSGDDCSRVNFEEENDYDDCTEAFEEDCDTVKEDFDIEVIQNGKFKLSLSIPSVYFPLIIGSKAVTKKRIENDTNSQIIIPYKGMQGDIFITARDKKCVRQAAIKIQVLVERAKKRQPFTHFLSIPMNDKYIQDGFLQFKDKVLNSCGTCRGVDETIFQDSTKLHLTLGVAVLSDSKERNDAISQMIHLQNDIYVKFGKDFPYRVEVKGIEYMNDDPGEIDVIYGKIESSSLSDNFQEFCEYISTKLEDAGVLLKQFENLKLHVTLMNTVFRSTTDQSGNKQRDTFNGREILEEFRNFYFGEMEVNEIHLSVRYSTASNGYFKSSTKFSLLLDD